MNVRSTLLIATAFLVGCMTTAAQDGTNGPAEFAFESFEINTGPAAYQTVLTGFLLGGDVADLAVLQADDDGARRLKIFSFAEGTWSLALETELRGEVLFVDLGRIGAHERLLTFEQARVNWFDPGTATERPLLDIALDYRATASGEIPQLDLARDLNGDGLDDLVVPGVQGFDIAVQARDGTFSDPVRLGPPEPFAAYPIGNFDVDEPDTGDERTYGEVGITAATVPVYLDRIHRMDYDLDGRSDLAFWNGDHFDIHLQGAGGRFSPQAETLKPSAHFESDGVYTRAFDHVGQGAFSTMFGTAGKTQRTVLHSVSDVNGDAIADLVTLELSGRSILRQRSVYRVYLGRPEAGRTEYARAASMRISPRGKAGGLQPWGYASQWFTDFDGDGRLDILFRDVKVGFGGMGRAMLGNSVPVNLDFYRAAEGAYPGKPTTRRKIRRFAPFAGIGNVFFPAVRVGDIDGDGRQDVLVGHSPEALHILPGIPGPEVLARKPVEVAVAVPNDERNTWLADLDGDGRQDILLLHEPADQGRSEAWRIAILFGR